MPKVKWLGACNNVHRMRFVALCFASFPPPFITRLALPCTQAATVAAACNLWQLVCFGSTAFNGYWGKLPTASHRSPYPRFGPPPSWRRHSLLLQSLLATLLGGIKADWQTSLALIKARRLIVADCCKSASVSSQQHQQQQQYDNSNNNYYKILAINTRVCNQKKKKIIIKNKTKPNRTQKRNKPKL